MVSLTTDQELARVGPGQLVESLDGDQTAVIELSLVDNIWSFFAVLRDYVVGGEATRGGFQLVQAEFSEARP